MSRVTHARLAWDARLAQVRRRSAALRASEARSRSACVERSGFAAGAVPGSRMAEARSAVSSRGSIGRRPARRGPMPAFDVDALRARFPALAIEQEGHARGAVRRPGRHPGPGLGDRGGERLLPDVEREPRRHVPHLASGATRSSTRRTPRSRTCSTPPSPDEIKFGANMTTLTMHLARSITAGMQPGDVHRRSRAWTTRRTSGRGWASPRTAGSTVRTVGIRPGRRHARHRGVRHDPPRAAEARRVRLGVERGRVDQPGRRARAPRARGGRADLSSTRSTPRPHLPIDVQAVGTDFLACSVYKFFGPHVGVLYGRRRGARRAADVQAAASPTTGSRPGRSTTRGSPGRWPRSSTSPRSGGGSGRRPRRRSPG